MAKGRKKPIAKTTKSRADKRGGRVFLDVCGPKSVRSIGEKEYASVFDKPPASCCITHERTYLLPPSRK